jgi:hypothetical protein
MNIYDIKNLTSETAPYFFTKETMKFFGQTMRSFKIKKQLDGRYKIEAPMKNRDGEKIGSTTRYFNPINNELEIN